MAIVMRLCKRKNQLHYYLNYSFVTGEGLRDHFDLDQLACEIRFNDANENMKLEF